MSQEQPKTLPRLRTLQIQKGYDAALKEAAREIDHLVDLLCHKNDMFTSRLIVIVAGSFLLGFLIGKII